MRFINIGPPVDAEVKEEGAGHIGEEKLLPEVTPTVPVSVISEGEGLECNEPMEEDEEEEAPRDPSEPGLSIGLKTEAGARLAAYSSSAQLCRSLAI